LLDRSSTLLDLAFRLEAWEWGEAPESVLKSFRTMVLTPSSHVAFIRPREVSGLQSSSPLIRSVAFTEFQAPFGTSDHTGFARPDDRDGFHLKFTYAATWTCADPLFALRIPHRNPAGPF